MNHLLEFKNVCYGYDHGNKKKWILQDVNFKFKQGKFYTIVGPSGTGKTTFLSLAGALDVPKSGEVLYKEKNINHIGLSRFRNQHVSIVFQSYNLLLYMTALQNIVTAIEITNPATKNKKKFALEMLNKVGITEEQAKQKVLSLSGGQQQRVSIARSLACKSDLIVADEPTGNLDENTAMRIIEIFQDLAHRDGKCVIMVTHNQDIAQISDLTLKLSNKKFIVINNINPPN